MENNSKRQNKIYWVYITGFFLILTLPLLSSAPLFHPPAWGKTIVFRIIFSILIFIFIYQILFKKYNNNFSLILKKLLDRKSNLFWPFWLLIALLVINFLATIFSIEPHFSFWGSPLRSGGFLNYVFYILFAILIFLIVKAKDWQKIWNFSLLIGVLVAFIAICQKFSLLGDQLISYTWRPVATIGGPMFLATYLMLLSILSISFGLTAKSNKRANKKKIYYFFCFFLFLFVILLTATRSSFFGLFIGLFFFVFLFPTKHSEKTAKKKIVWVKILLGIILISAVLGVFWLKKQPQVVENLKHLGPSFTRIWSIIGEFSIESIFQSRADGWKIGFEGIKDKPILGYGPENFSIAFDKYYDSSLPGITRLPGGAGSSSWWDKAHNFLLDIAVTAGIPALIIYLSLFGVLFWQLQKTKNREQKTENKIIAHGIQATFIAYLSTNLFNFDLFSTYLISFLIIGYSLFIINKNNIMERKIERYKPQKPWKYVLLFVLFFVLIWFIWQYNLKPLQINSEINKSLFLVSHNKKCDEAISKMEKIMPSQSIIDNYLRLQYIDVISQCLKYRPEYKLGLSQKAVQILEEAAKLRPSYTRTWEFSGIYATKIINSAQEQRIEIKPEIKKELVDKAYLAFERAHQLSPGRQKIFNDLAQLNMALENFYQAEENSNRCINLNPQWANCYWTKALIKINLDEKEEAAKNMEMAEKNGYLIDSPSAIGQLINVYSKLAKKTNNLNYYQYLIQLYQRLIDQEPENPRYHASLAYVYKEMGEYQEAKKQALIILELSPESKKSVEEFLETLPY